MNTLTNDTALLLFSRTASAEASNKILINNKKQNLHALKHLIGRSKLIAKKSHIPLFLSTEADQVGNSFGEKICGAVASIFDKGFNKIIVIGNDCLQLSSNIIQHAATELNQHQLVISPTKNGGVSLIGLSKENFVEKGFAEVRWQTDSTFSDLIDLASQSISPVSILPLLNDVNTHSDLVREISLLTFFDKFKSLIQNFLSTFFRFIFVKIDHRFQCFSSIGFRGPPSLV